MGRSFGGQDRSGSGGARLLTAPASVVACLCAIVAIAGCGESSSGGSASVASTTTTASAPTGPTGATASTGSTGSTGSTKATTPASTSTAAKQPASKSSGSSTSTAKTKTAPAPKQPAKSASKPASKPASKEEKTFGKIKVTSTAFKAGGPIATKYTCDGAGISPPLEWRGVPKGTAEIFVLAVALSGTTHEVIQWAIAGIPPTTTSIPEGGLPAGAFAGVNSAGKNGWGGMCGTKGQLQRVGFLFYALSNKLKLNPGFNPIEVRGGLKGVTLATGLTLATHLRT